MSNHCPDSSRRRFLGLAAALPFAGILSAHGLCPTLPGQALQQLRLWQQEGQLRQVREMDGQYQDARPIVR